MTSPEDLDKQMQLSLARCQLLERLKIYVQKSSCVMTPDKADTLNKIDDLIKDCDCPVPNQTH